MTEGPTPLPRLHFQAFKAGPVSPTNLRASDSKGDLHVVGPADTFHGGTTSPLGRPPATVSAEGDMVGSFGSSQGCVALQPTLLTVAPPEAATDTT